MSLDRLNQYRIMWVIVYFDLPTETKKDKRAYTDFRKSLLKVSPQASTYFLIKVDFPPLNQKTKYGKLATYSGGIVSKRKKHIPIL